MDETEKNSKLETKEKHDILTTISWKETVNRL